MNNSLWQQLHVDVNTVTQLWMKINKRFDKKNVLAQNKVKLQLQSKHIQSKESFKNHIFALRKFCTECMNVKLMIDDKKWLAVIMQSLQNHSKYIVVNMFDMLYKNLKTLISTLKLNELHVINKNETTLQALSRSSQTNNQRQYNKNKSNIRTLCSNCNHEYHII